MKPEDVIDLVFKELRAAEAKHPMWPKDPIHAAAILGEEAGELLQASIDFTYRKAPQDLDKMAKEAAQCAAMGIRFLVALERYRARPSRQRKTSSVRGERSPEMRGKE